jgi:hypothetical protein
MPSSTSGDRQTIAATIILRRNENTGQDEVFLEERLDTAVGGGTIGIVGGKLDQKDVGEVKERCRLEPTGQTQMSCWLYGYGRTVRPL